MSSPEFRPDDHVAGLLSSLTPAMPLDRAADVVLERIARATQAQSLLLLRRGHVSGLDVVSSLGADPAGGVQIDVISGLWSVLAGRGAITWRSRAEAPSALRDVDGFDRGSAIASGAPGTTSWLLLLGDHVPEVEDLVLPQRLLDVGALALDRAAVKSRLRRADRVVRHVADLAGHLGAAASPEALLKAVAEGMHAIPGVEGVVVWRLAAPSDGSPPSTDDLLVEVASLDGELVATAPVVLQRVLRLLVGRVDAVGRRLLAQPARVAADGPWLSLLPVGGNDRIAIGLVSVAREDDLVRTVLVSLAASVGPALRELSEVSERRDMLRGFVDSLKPEQFPEWLDIGVEHHPNTHAEDTFGGDFYDVMDLRANGQAVLCLGDVSGKGIGAASTAAASVWSLRGLGSRGARPSIVAALFNSTVADHLSADRFVTLAYILLEKASFDGHLLLAGHPDPVVVRPGEEPQLLGVRPNPPLGVPGRDASFPTTAFHLEPGEALVLYTDGATDAVGRDGSRAGPELLLRAAAAHVAGEWDASSLAAALWAAVRRHAGDAPDDDCAFLVLRRPVVG